MGLQKLHFPLDSYKSQLFRGSISVVEIELFSGLNGPFREYSYPMVAVDFEDFGVAIRINGMIGETNFVAFSRSIDDELVVEVEKK